MTLPPVPDQLIVMTYLNQIRTHFMGQELSVLHIEKDSGESSYAVAAEKRESQDDLETNIRYCAQKLQEGGLSLESVGGATKRDSGSSRDVVPPPRAKWQRAAGSGGAPPAPVAPPRIQLFSKSSFFRVKDADLVRKRRSQKRSGSAEDGSASPVGRRPGLFSCLFFLHLILTVFGVFFPPQSKRLLLVFSFLVRKLQDKMLQLRGRSRKCVSWTQKSS